MTFSSTHWVQSGVQTAAIQIHSSWQGVLGAGGMAGLPFWRTLPRPCSESGGSSERVGE